MTFLEILFIILFISQVIIALMSAITEYPSRKQRWAMLKLVLLAPIFLGYYIYTLFCGRDTSEKELLVFSKKE